MVFHRVLIALDESVTAAHAVEVGADLARALHAQSALVYVADPRLAYEPDSGVPLSELVAAAKYEGQAFLATAAQRLGDPPPWQFLKEGTPADEIVTVAREWQADLIVIGTHGRSGVVASRVDEAQRITYFLKCDGRLVKRPLRERAT